jgi:hypothetical protein
MILQNVITSHLHLAKYRVGWKIISNASSQNIVRRCQFTQFPIFPYSQMTIADACIKIITFIFTPI